MEYFYGFLVALAVGVVISLLGYFLNLRTLRNEEKKRSNEQLCEAVRNLLVEIEANLEIVGTAKDILGRERIMMAFSDRAWEYHRGRIYALPEDIQTSLHQFYMVVVEANSVVKQNLQLPHNAGYLDTTHKSRVDSISEKVVEVKSSLNDWQTTKCK